jgi:hypothetical protein
MSNGFASSHRWLIFPLAMTLVTGCNKGLEQHQSSTTGRPVKESSQLLNTYREDQRNALRTRTDTVRGRVWLLSTDGHVHVYDHLSKRLLRQITLPAWFVVKTPCMPDLILDRSGSAFISSNLRPWIWRINADTFEVRVHEVSLRGREDLDFGFATLAFTGKGALYGLSPSANSVWNIDVIGASANMVEFYSPPLEECALTAQSLDRLETSR